jgi:Uma2 family endonuclease
VRHARSASQGNGIYSEASIGCCGASRSQLSERPGRHLRVLWSHPMLAERNEPVPTFLERWTVPDTGVTVPEAPSHDQALELLKAVLAHWVSCTHRDAAVYRDIAVRVRQDKPQVGFNPDIAVVEPAPPAPYKIDSVCLWKAGNTVPSVAIEVVSKNHPHKDYTDIPDRCAAAGVGELIVFDPRLVGPRAHGGPHLIQLWRRGADGAFDRVHAGDGPAWSERLTAWLVPVQQGGLLRVSEDREGIHLWPTAEETERTAKETERAAKEAAHVEAQAAQAQAQAAQAQVQAAQAQAQAAHAETQNARARIAELEAELRRRS